MKPRQFHLIGKKFGRLKVLKKAGSNHYGRTLWHVRCSCPLQTKFITLGANLTSGRTRSCGCLNREILSALGRARGGKRSPVFKHGHSKSRTYKSWICMNQRCYNKNNTDYKNYGGRGIRVWARWRKGNPLGFQNFLADLGVRPKGTSLDRYPNRDGNYTPSNVRWANPKQQNRHLRTVKLNLEKARQIRKLSAAGVPPKKIAKRFDVDPSAISHVIHARIWMKPRQFEAA